MNLSIYSSTSSGILNCSVSEDEGGKSGTTSISPEGFPRNVEHSTETTILTVNPNKSEEFQTGIEINKRDISVMPYCTNYVMQKPVYRSRFTKQMEIGREHLKATAQEIVKDVEEMCKKEIAANRAAMEEVEKMLVTAEQKFHQAIKAGILSLFDELHKTNQTCELVIQLLDIALKLTQMERLSNELEREKIIQQLKVLQNTIKEVTGYNILDPVNWSHKAENSKIDDALVLIDAQLTKCNLYMDELISSSLSHLKNLNHIYANQRNESTETTISLGSSQNVEHSTETTTTSVSQSKRDEEFDVEMEMNKKITSSSTANSKEFHPYGGRYPLKKFVFKSPFEQKHKEHMVVMERDQKKIFKKIKVECLQMRTLFSELEKKDQLLVEAQQKVYQASQSAQLAALEELGNTKQSCEKAHERVHENLKITQIRILLNQLEQKTAIQQLQNTQNTLKNITACNILDPSNSNHAIENIEINSMLEILGVHDKA